jgi:hypothetical protein
MQSVAFCAYDGKGDLFVGGSDSVGSEVLGELPAGSSNFINIKIPAEPYIIESMQWAGKYLAVTERSGVIDHLTVSGARGSIPASTLLDANISMYSQFWIQGGTIISPYETTSETEAVGVWAYPAGGRVRKSIGGATLKDGDPFAAVVSPGGNKRAANMKKGSATLGT